MEIDRNAFEMEYNTLREEIIKRIELRQQLLGITLTVSGVIFAFALSSQHQELALIYPPLAALLALAWAQNDYGLRIAGLYIRNYMEIEVPTLMWETFMRDPKANKKWSGLHLSSSHVGIFF